MCVVFSFGDDHQFINARTPHGHQGDGGSAA